ncbi:MAG: hypothetical protein V1773_16960 [bacterium]
MKKNNPIITATLAVVVILIWNIIIYQALDHFFEEDTEIVDFNKNGMTGEMSSLLEKQESPQVQYIKLNNDPFSFEEKQIVIKTSTIKAVTIKPVLTLSYSIKGIIINKNEKLVIVEDKESGSTQFVHEGNSYKGIKIVKIESTSVKILENGKTNTVEISN